MACPIESCRRLAPTTATLRAPKIRAIDAASARCSRERMTPRAESVGLISNVSRCTPSSSMPLIV